MNDEKIFFNNMFSKGDAASSEERYCQNLIRIQYYGFENITLAKQILECEYTNIKCFNKIYSLSSNNSGTTLKELAKEIDNLDEAIKDLEEMIEEWCAELQEAFASIEEERASLVDEDEESVYAKFCNFMIGVATSQAAEYEGLIKECQICLEEYKKLRSKYSHLYETLIAKKKRPLLQQTSFNFNKKVLRPQTSFNLIPKKVRCPHCGIRCKPEKLENHIREIHPVVNKPSIRMTNDEIEARKQKDAVKMKLKEMERIHAKRLCDGKFIGKM